MKIYIPLILTLVLAGALAQAAPSPALTVAVYDFAYPRHEPGGYGGKVTTLVTASLAGETNLVMLERARLSKALNEQAFGISGMVNSDAAARIGEITGAKVLVAGQVMRTGENHLVIVATVIGTETGRLFADQVEGPADHLLELTADLSRKIAQTINAQTTNLISATQESGGERLERIIKSINGTNRPTVSVNIHFPQGAISPSTTASGEFGMILMKAGFTVVDARSDQKPDVEITGVDDLGAGPHQGGLFTYRAVIDLKVQERRTGSILAYDRQESVATDATKVGASLAAEVNAVDALAERVLPLLAK